MGRLSHFLTADVRSAPLWLVVRVYLGWEWLMAGWEKIQNPAWVSGVGAPVSGFVQGALQKTGGAHPDVPMWYAYFLEHAVLPHVKLWALAVAYGEVLVGVALLLGFLVGISAFFGAFMNLNYLLAGTVSVNPVMYTLAIVLMLAWRVAGHWGVDRIVLPLLRRMIRVRRFGS